MKTGSSLSQANSRPRTDVLSKVWEDPFPGEKETRPNAFLEMKDYRKKAFEPLGEGFARKGRRIYYRFQKNKKATWLSTGTDKLPLARKWKEKWQREQWLRENGVIP